jgi:hypothetical protein
MSPKILVLTISAVVILGGFALLNRLSRLGYLDSALPNNELSAELVKSAQKNKCSFSIACTKAPGGRNVDFEVTARPLVSGMPAFCVDQSGIIKYHGSGSPEKCMRSGLPIN